MAHLKGEKKKLVSRIRRIQGQLEAIIRGVESGEDCFVVLQTAAACRGAFAGLLTELMDDHVRTHITEAKDLKKAQAESRELTRILRSYLK